MDIGMPRLNGIEATRRIREKCPGTHVVILSVFETCQYIYDALEAGAEGYLLKESAGDQVVKAVYAVCKGEVYLCRKIAKSVVQDYVKRGGELPKKGPIDSLSGRERQILQLVVEGKSSSEIADIVNLSTKTVETYRSRLMRKLGTKDIPSLVKFAILHGITPLN
jgi:DNA-binding NarL/FixJ family response regulator